MPGRTEFGRRLQPAALGGALVLGLAAMPAGAAEKDLTDKGKVLVEQNCARCHAIGKDGKSTHPEAPPFRTLSSRYPIEDLAELLAEGIVSGHPDMPIFVFSATDVEAIIEYLQLDPGPAFAVRRHPKSRIKRRRHPPATSANRVRPRPRRAKMLHVATHERRDQARPEMMRVGICRRSPAG